ncbi:UNVERIFIED_CONTAM: hypothetical protein NCL1_62245 [Trichonephila clavipes]
MSVGAYVKLGMLMYLFPRNYKLRMDTIFTEKHMKQFLLLSARTKYSSSFLFFFTIFNNFASFLGSQDAFVVLLESYVCLAF